MLLPDYPVGVYWPGNKSVLVYLSSSFLNVDLEPLASGVTIPVSAPGNILGIAPDGAELIYQGGDGGLMRWDRATQSSTVIPFGGAAYFANYSQDGQTIAIGSVDEMKVTLYDRATKEPFQTLSGFSTAAPVYSVVPGPGRGLVAWVARAKLQLQDMNNSSLGGELGYQDFIVAIAFSPDGSMLAIISGGLLQVINASVQADITAQDLILSTMDAPVMAVTFSPDGALVAAAVGKDVVIWETATWTRVTALPHRNPVRLVSFSPDGRALVVVDDAHVLRSWRVQ
jgi:WD40 repeat protein